MPRLALVAIVAGIPAAWAQSSNCAFDYGPQGLESAIVAVQQAFEQADLDYASNRLDDAYGELVCMPVPIDRERLGVFARQQAEAAFFGQDEARASRWARLANAVAPDLPWPPSMPEGHPFRSMVVGVTGTPVGGATGRSVLPPKDGAIVLDGELLLEPRALAETPHLVQVFDKHGKLVTAFWQDGAAFPDDVLGPAGPAPSTPKWWGDKSKPAVKPTKPYRKPRTPGEGLSLNAPRLAIAGGLAAVAGGLYIAGALTGAGIDGRDPENWGAARDTTNILVISSGVAALGAVGVGVTALLGDSPGIGFTLRF